MTTAEADSDWQLEERIGPVMSVGDHWWSVDDGTDVAALAIELRTVLADDALPWLEARGSLEQIVALARADPDGFPKHLISRFAMLLERSGLADLAAEFGRPKQ